MNIAKFIKTLANAGVFLTVENGQLGFKLAVNEFPEDLKNQVLANKPAIISFLSKQRQSAQSESLAGITTVVRQGQSFPLSYAQQRLWFIDQLNQGSPEYNLPSAFMVEGDFNVDVARRALALIISRHEILRTIYLAEEVSARQHIKDDFNFVIKHNDLSELAPDQKQQQLSKLMTAEVQQPFDLTRDLMFRACYIKLDSDNRRGALLFTIHHIASDGWSSNVFKQEFFTLYQAIVKGITDPLSPLTIQYADYAHWQSEYSQGEVLSKQLDYWKKQLAHLPVVHQLALDKPRPEIKQLVGEQVSAQLPKSVADGLRDQANHFGLTPFMLLHSALAVVLSRHSNSKDIVIGTPVANRLQTELKSLIGFFVNTLVLRLDTDHTTLTDYLAHVRQVHLDAQSNQDVPFEQLVARLDIERKTSHTPLFQIMLNTNTDYGLVSDAAQDFNLSGVNISPLGIDDISVKFDLDIHIELNSNGVALHWKYDKQLFSETHINQLNTHLSYLLTALVQLDGATRLNDWLMEPETAHANALVTTAYPKDFCYHQLLETQVANQPDAIALVFGQTSLTYAQLNQRANQLAHYLLDKHDIKPDTLVGLCVERSPEMVIGLLGIMKAGGAYVPLDPEYPQSRLDHMISDCALSVVLTHKAISGQVDFAQCKEVLLDSNVFDSYPTINVNLELISNNLVYVIYTSGSTGLPKGVLLEHKSLVNYCWHMKNQVLNAQISGAVVSSSLNFDFTATSLLCPLLAGLPVELLGAKEEIFDQLADRLFLNEKPLLFKLTPSHLVALSNHLDNPVKSSVAHQIIIGGELLPVATLNHWRQELLPNAMYVNHYGPSEATVGCCINQIDQTSELEGHSISIGKAIQNTHLIVLDDTMQPVPKGAIGQLYIGGAGLARGYLNQAVLTDERFVNHNGRWYQTGDLVRQNPDGQLAFIGRIDDQIKIRGFRVELGEIEKVMMQHPLIALACVMPKDGPGNNKQLVAYCQLNDWRQQTDCEISQEAMLDEWSQVFEHTYQEHQSDVTFDLTGWNSSFTGEAIEVHEMREWLSETIARILSLKPQNILEVGCGAGLMLHSLVKHCRFYSGFDLSHAVITQLEKTLDRLQIRNAAVCQGVAEEVSQVDLLPDDEVIDTVIINSVAQYFPNLDYLDSVITQSIEKISEGRIFLGDILDFRLLETFHLSVEAYKVSQESDEIDWQQVKRNAAAALKIENELFVSPEYFINFSKRFAQVFKVDVLPKKGQAQHEMNRFRYDVVIHITKSEVHTSVEDIDWINYNGTSLASIMSNVQDTIGVTAYPNLRVWQDTEITQVLLTADDQLYGQDLLAQGTDNLLSVDQLYALAEQHQYQLYVSLNTTQSCGCAFYDLLFYRDDSVLPAYFARRAALQRDGDNAVWANVPVTMAERKPSFDSVREHLLTVVPDYMIPGLFLEVDEIPLTLNGKIDKQALLALEKVASSKFVAPRNKVETQLCSIWKQVLQLEQVGIEDNFFALGGDSIVSIQVASRAKRQDLYFTVRQLFEHQTIAELAPFVRLSDGIKVDQGAVSGPMPLMPIQTAFFARQLPQQHHYNQSVLLQTPVEFNTSSFTQAVAVLYKRHDALRLRFTKDEDIWLANHQPYSDQMVEQSVVCHDLSGMSDADKKQTVEQTCDQQQRSLSISKGPLFRANYFYYGESLPGRLFLVCHHLVIDGVSWRILLKDLESTHRQTERGDVVQLGEKTSAYKDWAQALVRYSQTEQLLAERQYWVEQLSKSVGHMPLLTTPDTEAEAISTCTISLDESQTKALLLQCNQVYRTQINELLLAALLRAFARWTGQGAVRINMEGHGREALFDDIDTNETQGWFTSVYPLILSDGLTTQIGDLIKSVKEQYRTLPHHGIGFGVLKYLTGDEQIQQLDTISHSHGLMFNYLGQFDNTFSEDSAFGHAGENTGPNHDESQALNNLLSINGAVSGGCMGFNFEFSGQRLARDEVSLFADEFKQSLLAVIEHCQSEHTAIVAPLTPSDFPNATLSMSELAGIQKDYSDISRLYITTPMQRGMLYHGLVDGTGALYTNVKYFDLHGELDVDSFKLAWESIVTRHDILRSCFVGLELSVPHQLVYDSVDLPFEVLDWRSQSQDNIEADLAKLRTQEKARGFDFSQAPLMRITLVRLPGNRYHFIWAIHHILLDGWCNPVLFNEVIQCYRAFSQGEIPQLASIIPYENYIGWLYNRDEKSAVVFWQSQLSGFDTPTRLNLSTPDKSSFKEGYGEVNYSASVNISDAIIKLAKDNQCTMNVVLQLAWSYVLHRYSGESDVLFGATVSGRPADLSGIEKMIGLFINTIPVRIKFDGEQTISDLLHKIHTDNVDREQYSYMGLSEVQAMSDVAQGTALFDSTFVFENFPREVVSEETSRLLGQAEGNSSSKVQVNASGAIEQTNYSLNFEASYQQTLDVKLTYHQDVYSEEAIRGLLVNFEVVLEDMVANGSEAKVNELSILQTQYIDDFINLVNDTQVDYPKNKCIHELFEAQVLKTPDDIAVVYGELQLTYTELNEKANRLAHRLVGQKVVADSVIGLCVNRSMEMLVGLLGILKAGGAYLPLDPSYPEARLQYLLDDSNVDLLLMPSKLQGILPLYDGDVVLLDNVMSSYNWLQNFDSGNLYREDTSVNSNSLAYVIYTSGSTGKPKGVEVNHSCVVNYLEHAKTHYCADVVGSVVSTPLSFDATVTSVFTPLICGGFIQLINQGDDELFDLAGVINNAEQNLLFKLTPSHLQAIAPLMAVSSPYLQHAIVIGGEQLPTNILKQFKREFLPGSIFINEYGPTEGTVGCCFEVVKDITQLESDESSIAIGKPIANTRLYVLDNQQRIVPQGAMGELYIGGEGLARGYQNLPDVTNTHFIDLSINLQPAQQLYKTGDLVRYLTDNRLQYIGRIDQQVKLRGFRIEIGEIEHHLNNQPEVTAATVMVREDEPGLKRLVAYLTVEPNSCDENELNEKLRNCLQSALPQYMVPSAFVVLTQLPLTSNGKVDKVALPSPGSVLKTDSYIEPRTEIEKQLCSIWSEVLKIDQIGIEDNFFSLGGDSIVSIQIASRAKLVNCHFSVRELFEHQTIAQLAPFVRQESDILVDQGMVEGGMPLLPIQASFFALEFPQPHHFNQAVLLEVPADFYTSHLNKIVAALYHRHDALRLRFNLVDGEQVAEHQSYSAQLVEQSIDLHDISHLSSEQRKYTLEQTCDAQQRRLSFTTGPLFKVNYFNYGAGIAGRLLLVCHHLVIDGVSWRILLKDLEFAHNQCINGEEVKLLDKTSSFQSWGNALSNYARSEQLMSERTYWVEQLSKPVGYLPVMSVADTSAPAMGPVRIVFEEAQTQALLSDCNKTYRTQINELLLAALLKAYQEWTRQSVIRINMEGHGREALFDALDTNETLGWFTSVYPLILSTEPESGIGELIKSVKEQYRVLPNHGIGFGVLKYLTGDEQIQQLDTVSHSHGLMFNYLGQFDNTLSEKSNFVVASENYGATSSDQQSMADLISISGAVRGGQLRFNFDYAAQHITEASIQEFADYFHQSLLEVIAHCQSEPSAIIAPLTPSDFPYAQMSASKLTELQADYTDISHMYITTPMQRGMLYHGLVDGSGALYTNVTHFDLHGELDVAAFKQAWQLVVAGHDTLRTSFVGLEASMPHQLVTTSVDLPFKVLDWRDTETQNIEHALAALREQEKSQGFDFSKPPLMRITLVRLADERYHFVWSIHHIIIDGWCNSLLFKEVIANYRVICSGGTPKSVPGIPYENYIGWLSQTDEQAAKSFWQSHLAGFDTPTSLSACASRVTSTATGFGELHLNASPKLSQSISQFAKENQCTVNVILQLAWSYVLHRYSGESDVLFGSVVSGRPAELAGIEQMIGLFINTIPVRVQLDENKSIKAQLQEIQKDNISREQYSYLTLSEVQKVSEVAQRTAFFESLFVFENYPTDIVGKETQEMLDSLDDSSASNVQITGAGGVEQTNYPITITASFERNLQIKLDYQKEFFGTENMQSILDHLQCVLENLVELSGKQALNCLEMLSESEIEHLAYTLNSTDTEYPANQSLQELFELQVKQNPEYIAVKFGEQQLTYQAVNERANQIAHYLLSHKTIHRDMLIGLCVERSIDMVVGALAILKAGAAYVPIDPNNPAERIEYMLQDSDIQLVLTQSELASQIDFGNRLLVDLSVEAYTDFSSANISVRDSELCNKDLAYVIYTSGSTGHPKGVLIEHQAIVGRYFAWEKAYKLKEQCRTHLQLAGLSFDVCTGDMVRALCSGGTLVICPKDVLLSGPALYEILVTNKVDFAEFTPALLRHLCRYIQDENKAFPKMAYLAVGSDAWSLDEHRETQALLSGSTTFVNTYGLTECTVDSTIYVPSQVAVEGGSIANIGKAMDNVKLYVLDSSLKMMPFGVIGELYIGGLGLSRGYLNRDELTQECFIENPFATPKYIENGHARIYKTGDLVRYLPNGELEFIGRADVQVKILGHRIELGEIEYQIGQYSEVASVVVTTRGDDEGNKYLVAYMQRHLTQATVAENLELVADMRELLQQVLPSYMVPKAFVVINEWPLTPNGKVDHKSLPEPEFFQEEYLPPETETQHKLVRIWSEKLDVPENKISITANFFELGGHSLLIMQLINGITEVFNIELSVVEIFERTTLSMMAIRIDELTIELQEQSKLEKLTAEDNSGHGVLI